MAYSQTQYDKAVVDFIYSLTSAADASLTGTLYQVDCEAWNGTNFIGTTSGTISYSDFTAYSDPKEKSNILKFPGNIGNNLQRYAVLRVLVPVNNGADHLVIKLKALNTSADIYVQGFRIRSQLMDDLERGNLDSYLGSTNGFQGLLDNYSTLAGFGSCAAIQNLNAITGGGELYTEDAFRSLAYVDNFLAKYTATQYKPAVSAACTSYRRHPIHIYTYLDDNRPEQYTYSFGQYSVPLYAWYRSIYEDETGKVPPPIMAEGGLNLIAQSVHGGKDESIPLPADGLDNALVNNSHFQGQLLSAITGRSDPSGRTWSQYGTTTTTTIPNYYSYENNWLSYFSSHIQNQMSIAVQAANPPGGVTGKWYAFPPTNMGIINANYQDATGNVVGASEPYFKSTLTASVEYHRRNCTPMQFDDVWKPVADQISGGAVASVFPKQVERTLFATEIRAYVWSALAYGAKGVFFNTVGSDGGGNIGITNELFQHDYDYDLNGSRDPLIRMQLGKPPATDGSPTEPILPKSAYDSHLLKLPNQGRWIPIVDGGGHAIVKNPGAGEVSIAKYISDAGGNQYGIANYYSVDGVAHTDWDPDTHGGCDGNERDCWDRYWQSSDNPSCPWYTSVPAGLWTLHWPYWGQGSMQVQTPGLYQGFQERWLGATTVAKDLQPITTTLSQLDWLTSIDFNAVFNTRKSAGSSAWTTATNVSPIDLGALISRKASQYYGVGSYLFSTDQENIAAYASNGTVTRDPETSINIGGFKCDDDGSLTGHLDRRFYQFGFFQPRPVPQNARPTGPQLYGQFVIITNARSWPVWYDPYTVIVGGEPTVRNFVRQVDLTDATHHLLGDIDSRTLFFKLNLSIVNPKNLAYPKYTVYNANTGTRQVHGINDYFHVSLDPGQGALIQIAPGIHSTLYEGGGGPPPYTYNNGRHFTSFEQDALTNAFLSVFSAGGLFVSCPRDTIDGVSRRESNNPVDSLIDPAKTVRNPSIACNSDNTTIGLVYAVDSSGAAKDQSLVIFRLSHAATPYSYSGRDTLSSVPMTSGSFVAPSITPASHGNFWIGWRNGLAGGVVALVDTTGHIIAQPVVNTSTLLNTKQISVGSVLHPLSTFHGYSPAGAYSAVDTCYVAFQAGLPGSTQIYFVRVNQRLSNPAVLDTTGGFCASYALPWCENINPQIHVTPERALAITWDGISNTGVGDAALPGRKHQTVLLRRSPFGQWMNYTSFSGFTEVLDPGAADTLSTFPVYSGADMFTNPSDSSWQDYSRIAWTNPIDDHVHMAHYGNYGGLPVPAWELAYLTEQSQDPVMAARTKFDGVLQPLMYRFPKRIDTLADDIAITSVDFPLGTATDTSTHVQTYIFHPVYAGCPPKFVGRGTDILLKRPDTSYIMIWKNGKPYLWDSVSLTPTNFGMLSQSDGDSILRTDNFRYTPGSVLQYGRYFRIGNYVTGDTVTAITQLLSGLYDTLSMKFLLRNANTGAVIQTLESAQLTQQGFAQTGSLADSGQASDTLNYVSTDSVYMSFEAGHTSSSTAQLSRMESFDNSSMDVTPIQVVSYDTAFKPSAPPKAGQAEHSTSTIEMLVYPNPLNQSTHVNVIHVAGLNTVMTLYDVMGNQLSEQYRGMPTNSTISMDVNASKLQSGTYFLRVSAGSEVVTKRLTIVR
jgi:hypothetical protein